MLQFLGGALGGTLQLVEATCGVMPYVITGTIFGDIPTQFTRLMTGVCGNGVVENGEECDDGNFVSTDACTASCHVRTCGNGYLEPGRM